MMLLRAIRSSWLEIGAVIEPSCQSEVAATLLRLPSKRSHPTLAETTVPQRGRLVRAPGLLLMNPSCRAGLGDYNRMHNILFTRELARRLQGTGVTANCLHPGFVATRFDDQSGALMSRLVWLAKFFAISPAKGALTIVYLASASDVAKTTGQYFYESIPAIPSRAAQDDRTASLLWQRSAALAGMKE